MRWSKDDQERCYSFVGPDFARQTEKAWKPNQCWYCFYQLLNLGKGNTSRGPELNSCP